MPPPSIPISPAQAAKIASLHGLPADHFAPIRSVGIINSVYALGTRHVLRVPRHHPIHVEQAYREAAAIPAAVAAGVRTPQLVVFDDSLEILPVPYLIVERVDGTDAESLAVTPPEPHQAWRHLGADLARLHLSRTPPPAGVAGPDETVDPRQLLDRRAADGWISPLEARRFHAWLDKLATITGGHLESTFIHGDVQMSNVLLNPSTHAYEALIDWGCARLGDPALDFRVVPLAAVSPLLTGYRDVTDATPVLTEARILWRRLQVLLSELPRGAEPGCAWGERPVAWLTDLLFHLATSTDETWRQLSPA